MAEDQISGAGWLMREKYIRDMIKRYMLPFKIIHVMVENDDFYKKNRIELLKICLEDLECLLNELRNQEEFARELMELHETQKREKDKNEK